MLAARSGWQDFDVGQEMKTTQDPIARQIPWDLAFASGIPLFLFVAVLGGLFSLPAVWLGYMISFASIAAISGAGLMRCCGAKPGHIPALLPARLILR